MNAPAPPRWGRCPHCLAPAEVLFARLRCTGEVCRWYDARAAEEWAVAALEAAVRDEPRARRADPWGVDADDAA